MCLAQVGLWLSAILRYVSFSYIKFSIEIIRQSFDFYIVEQKLRCHCIYRVLNLLKYNLENM